MPLMEVVGMYTGKRGGGEGHGGVYDNFLDGGGTGTLAGTFPVHQQCPIISAHYSYQAPVIRTPVIARFIMVGFAEMAF